MFLLCRVSAFPVASQMARYPLALEEHLHRARRVSHLHLLTDKLVGHAVVVLVHLHVVVYEDLRPLPLGILVA